MRKFSSQRLYKLVRALVILATIGCLYLAYDYPRLSNQAVEHSIQSLNVCRDNYKSDLKTYSFMKNPALFAQQLSDICTKSTVDFWSQQAVDDSKNGSNALFLGILLPLVFFGGRLIYKYIFPKVKKD